MSESVVSIQLKEYLLMHDFIINDQSAYLKNHSTENDMHKVIPDLLDNVNEGMLSGVFLFTEIMFGYYKSYN